MAFDDLIERKLIFIDEAEDVLSKALVNADNQLIRELLKIYSDFVERGLLQVDPLRLAQLNASIITAIQATDYRTIANSYLQNFEGIELLNKQLHQELNGIDISKALAENERIINNVERVTTQLRGTPTGQTKVVREIGGELIEELIPYRNTSLDQLIAPLADIMREDIIQGVSFDSATERISQAITKNELGLERWSKQIARDALSQQDGLIQNEVRKEFDLQWITYVGTIKGTTRPFCDNMIKNHQSIRYEELEPILAEYIPDGVPSTTGVTYYPLGKEKNSTKGAGMIPGTDMENFTIRRGGYNCRHQAIPTASPP